MANTGNEGCYADVASRRATVSIIFPIRSGFLMNASARYTACPHSVAEKAIYKSQRPKISRGQRKHPSIRKYF